ncbi:hypothetical protein STVIR_5895 [Streptomyces viridochromogenes Tue57]|uniref:Uncharacterized protein n=1 Tax=Streptomyces viridochromogenes Tue57 TaxID=1160705 RepID=L8PAK0_STRVR|nr:hypothetical protein STVIR_5895 [Streptomyces viridochromogenes Tue57]
MPAVPGPVYGGGVRPGQGRSGTTVLVGGVPASVAV